MARNPEFSNHYSEQGGHWLRGEFQKVRAQAERQGFPFFRGVQPNQPSRETTHVIRRSMRRTPQSGKK